ncbi:MAG: hypothetical protein AAB403_12630, partial [Planctomycetota bacterium]
MGPDAPAVPAWVHTAACEGLEGRKLPLSQAGCQTPVGCLSHLFAEFASGHASAIRLAPAAPRSAAAASSDPPPPGASNSARLTSRPPVFTDRCCGLVNDQLPTRGGSLLRQTLAQTDVTVKAVCDIDPQARDQALSLAARHQPQSFTEWKAVVDLKD